MIIRLLLL